MNNIIIYLLFLLNIEILKCRSEEFEKCINLERAINSPSDCINIKIPDYEGYKCCSMKIGYNGDSSYSCLALENKYATSKEVLNEYLSKKDISFLFASFGGQMEVECGGYLHTIENYKKYSNEYLNCYNNNIKGIENETDCIENDIPSSEGSKCCFVETSIQTNDGNIINDKRCYLIKDDYFTKDKNLNSYLLDESNINSLDEINNTNVTIICKNYDKFYFISKQKNENNPLPSNDNQDEIESDETIQRIPPPPIKDSSSRAWVIILIILGIIIFVGIIIAVIIVIYRRKKKKMQNIDESNVNKEPSTANIKTNS